MACRRLRPGGDELEERLKSGAIRNTEAFLLVLEKEPNFSSFKRVS
jgi:hypothetical protein